MWDARQQVRRGPVGGRAAGPDGATARRMREMNKSHWAESYVGRPYVEGAHDCADFVVAVMREHFGRELTLPAHGAGTRAWDRQIAALKGVYAVHVAPEARGSTVAPEARGTMGTPREGDGVLMAAAARRHSLGHHIGIWCAVAGEPYVLHCLKGVGSILHPIRDLDRRALLLEGVYRWR